MADLMRHEAGLAAFDTTLEVEDLLGENIKKNKVGRVVEKQSQSYQVRRVPRDLGNYLASNSRADK